MKKVLLLGAIISATIFTSCEVEEATEKSLTGQWGLQSSVLLGQTVPGDDSYLQFEECGTTECSGIDFKASDGSESTFTYVMSNDESTITINDANASEGGNWNGTWDVLRFSETELHISQTTIFGELISKFKKQ